ENHHSEDERSENRPSVRFVFDTVEKRFHFPELPRMIHRDESSKNAEQYIVRYIGKIEILLFAEGEEYAFFQNDIRYECARRCRNDDGNERRNGNVGQNHLNCKQNTRNRSVKRSADSSSHATRQ